jgi:hypothetical protein
MARRSSSPVRFRTPAQRPGVTFKMALEALHAGETLRLEYVNARPVWSLSDHPVSPEVASLLLSCGSVQPDADSLFADTPPQSWRIRS